VDNINAAYESLVVKGVKFQGPPQREAWGGSLAHFEDPSGNVLTLIGFRPVEDSGLDGIVAI
jgi:uncharacterized glyoxalase superfamily protein PhnB